MTPPDRRYLDRGVSAEKTGVTAATAGLDRGLYPGAFCRIFPDLLTGDPHRCVVVHTDDVGTKTSLAYLCWRESGDESVWRGIAQDSLAMNIDDIACVGALGPVYVTNTIARNAKLVPDSVLATLIEGYTDASELLSGCGIECHLVGGETSDCGDVVRTVFVESTVVASCHRDQVIDADRITVGDVIVSFSSTGQAAWESRPNSGIGSNGLTNARHDLLAPQYRRLYRETFSPEVPEDLTYRGPFRLEDRLPGDDRFTIGEALISPTRFYAPLIQRIIGAISREAVHGLVHCTGGGQTKIGRFGGSRTALRYVKTSLLPIPPLFKVLKEVSDVDWKEMYQVYNMGQLLEAVVPPDVGAVCREIAKEVGIDAVISGVVERSTSDRNEVIVDSENGEFRYSM